MRKRNIYTLKMAQTLIGEGFRPIAQIPSAKDLTKDVWVFEASEDFDRACAKYIAERKSRAERVKANTPKFSKRMITEMHLDKQLPIESIAKITGKSVDEVQKAIDDQIDLFKLFGIAAMTDKELQRLMSAETDEERNRLIVDRLKRGGFSVHGGRDSYEFPNYTVAEGVSEDA